MALYRTQFIETNTAHPTNTGVMDVQIDVLVSQVIATGPVANDVINIYKFPAGFHLRADSFLVECVTADIDTDATTELVWDVQYDDNTAGSSPTVLINDTADVAEAGDSDQIDAALNKGYIDVGGNYLQLKCVTAPETFGTTGVARVSFQLTRSLYQVEPFNVPNLSVLTT